MADIAKVGGEESNLSGFATTFRSLKRNKYSFFRHFEQSPLIFCVFPFSKAGMNYWLVKQEPAAYAWDQFVRDGVTAWTGVRNFQARNNLRAMALGDWALYYHSVTGKSVVGIAEVSREAYPDSTASEGDWSCVDLKPVGPLVRPVTLEEIKAEPTLADIGLLRQSRLSVMPITKEEFERIIKLAKK